MNFITAILSLLLGTKTSAKHSLHKQPTKDDFRRNLNCWIQRNFYIIALVILISVFVTFFIVCMVYGISATESGHYYNQFGGAI